MANFFRREYFNNSYTVTAGAPQVEKDIQADLLTTQSRSGLQGTAQFLRITTNKALSIRINGATADTITVPAATVSIPWWEVSQGAMQIATVWLATSGGCASGDATVTVFAV